MRILIGSFFFLPYEGGAEKQGRLLAAELARRRVEVAYVTARLPGTAAREKVDGVSVYRIPVGPRIRGLNRLLAEGLYHLGLRKFLHTMGQDYDIFQAQGVFDITAPIMAQAARHLGRRSVLRYSRMDDLAWLRSKSPVGWCIWRAVLEADASVTNSPAVHSTMISEYGVPPGRCAVIPNAVEVPARVDRERARQRLGWERDWRVVR